MARDDTPDDSNRDVEKSDESDCDMTTTDDSKHHSDRINRRKRRKRELKRLKIDIDGSNDDDSGSESQGGKRFATLGSPGANSPSHSCTREPRSCVLSQRQKRKPLSRLLEHLLRNLEKKDQNQFFAWPVTDDYAPNYSTIIKRPMDFSTMKQKIDDNMYKSLNCFIGDFKLMCNNALKYNKPGTVYHKAARKLLHLGMRQLVPEKLRPLGSILTYMYEIPIRELGFDMGKMDVKALKNGNANRESVNGEDEVKHSLSPEDEVKLKMEEIREQHRRRLAKKAFPRMDSNGYTSLQVLVDNDGTSPNCNQRPVSLGLFTGKISHGTGSLMGYKEDRRNLVKGVKPLNYGAFGSYAPSYDSTFATVSKEDSHLLYHAYGEETGLSTNEALLRFTPDSPWSCIYNMEQMFPNRSAPSSNDTVPDENDEEDVKIDFDQLRTLSDLGIDVDFLSEVEDDITDSQYDCNLQYSLKQNFTAIKKLENEQRDRLSQPLPAHLSLIAKPSLTELEAARNVVSNLKEMIGRVRPEHVTSVQSVRKAMGVTLDHLGTPMTMDELHEISPEHAVAPDQLVKENSNNSSEDTGSNATLDDNTKSEEEVIEKIVNGEDTEDKDTMETKEDSDEGKDN